MAVLNPTIEIVTFRLRGWCMLGVFLLPAFTLLGHECLGLLTPCHGMHVCTDQASVYTLIQKNNPLNRKIFPQRRIEPRTLHQAGQRAQHTTNELFQQPTETILRDVALRQKLLIKLVISSFHSLLTLGKPALAMAA